MLLNMEFLIMTPSPQHDRVSPEALELGYQPERAPVRGLLVFIVLVVATAVILHVLIWWLMKGIEARNAGTESPRSVLPQDQTPPEPQLQSSVGHDATDYQDLAALQRRENDMFTKLGWRVRPGAEDAEIPPDIIQRVAEQQRTRAAAPFAPPTTTGRNSNSIVPTTLPAGSARPNVEGGTP